MSQVFLSLSRSSVPPPYPFHNGEVDASLAIFTVTSVFEPFEIVYPSSIYPFRFLLISHMLSLVTHRKSRVA